MMRSIKSLPISQLLALSCLLAVTGVDGKVVVGSTRNEESNGTVSIVDIEDQNKTQYHNQNFEEGNYNYGYDISPSGPNGQFHHENKAADGVVYGCYGYLDPNNQAQITFYVSDAWGYRPVRQEQPVEVFFPAQNPEGTTDMKGDTIQWAELIFPEKCTYFAQQVAVAASSNVGQTLVGTPFSLAPGTPPFIVSTPAVNRRPSAPSANQFTTPIVVTPLGGIGNSRPATEQIRNPAPSIRTPTSQIRTPSPTIQTPFAPIRNPTPSLIPFTSAPISTGNSGNRNPAENGTQTSTTTTPLPVLTSTPVFNGSQGFGPDGQGSNQDNGGSDRFGNPGNTRNPGNPANPGNARNPGNPANPGNARNPGNPVNPANPGNTRNPGNSGNARNPGNPGNSANFGNTANPGNTRNPGNNGNNANLGNSRNPGNAVNLGNSGFGSTGKPLPNSNGFSGTPAFVDNSSPGPNSVVTDNRRPGGVSSIPRDGTPSTAFGGPANGVTPNVQVGGRVTSANTGLGNRNTDGNNFGQDVGPTKFPSTASVTPSGGQGSSPFTPYQPKTTGSVRNPTDGSTRGPAGEVPSSFYTEGSSSSIYPEGNHLSTGGPGSQPSSSNNVGETLEQEVEGSSSAIFPGRKTNSGPGNKLAPLKNNGSGGSSTSNSPSGNSRPTTSQAPTTPYEGSFQTADKRPSENPNKGNTAQPIRNGNTRDQQNGLNNLSGTTSGNGGITNNPGAFTNKPSGHGSNGQTPDFTTVPIIPSPSATEEFRETNRHSSPFTEEPSNSCPQVCNSCNANRPQTPEEIDYSQIPGAVVANVPVIFYPDCSTNAFSRPAVVPFCPSKQQASCSNQQPLTMKFPAVSSFNGNSNVPQARNAFASNLPSRTSRRVIRKTRHSQPDI